MKFEPSIESLTKSYERKYAARESRIHASLRRVTGAHHQKPVDRVPVIQMNGIIIHPRHEIFNSREKNLASQLANILLTLSQETDYVLYLDPFEVVTILSEAFDCRTEVPENGDPWIREFLIRENPRDVYSLEKPSKDSEVYRRVLETLEYFQRATGRVIPVGATDPQCPLDVESLIWDNTGFLLTCALHKKEVHHLLSLVTDAFIEFYSMQYELLKNPAYPVHSFPLVDFADGISVSDDEAIMLSSELYEEFGVPYLSRISKAFEGFYYHSCGDYGHIIDLICSIDSIRAVNGHVSPKEINPRLSAQIAARGIGLFAGISDREIGWADPDWSMDEITRVYDAYYIPAVIGATRGRRVVLVGYGGYQGYLDLQDRDSAYFVPCGGDMADLYTRTLTEQALTERVKELNCLYSVSKLFGRKDLPMDEILGRLIGILLPAWQYADIASARVVLDKQPYSSANFKETQWKLRVEISVFKRRAGFVEVCYVSKPEKTGKTFFLPAEKKLLRSVAELISSLVEQRESQTVLEQSAELLKAQKQELEEKNIALKEILSRIEIEKKEIQEQFAASVEKLVMPIVRRLGNRHLDSGQAEKYLHLLMTNLEGLTSAYARKMSDDKSRLSPREVEICSMVKDGLSSKEIADLLRISVLTVERHRHNARKKLGLAGEKYNLTTYLRKI